jgi:hypothetical protein
MTPEAIFGVQKFNAKKNDQTLGLINFGGSTASLWGFNFGRVKSSS